MKTWEEAEFEQQQEAIRKWAKKKLEKKIKSRKVRRMLNKLSELASVVNGNYTTAEIEFTPCFYVEDEDEDVGRN